VAGVSRGQVTAATFRRGYVGDVGIGPRVTAAGTRDSPGPITVENDPKFVTQYIENGQFVRDESPTITLPDLGYLEGYALYVTGRSDEVYNYSGDLKAYSVIQEILEGLAELKDVGIASGAALGDDQDLIIGLVAAKGLDVADLSRRLVERLGWPSAEKYFKLFQTAEIKRNQMGKVDREALVEQARRALGGSA
jgi:acyl-CoA synthetase (AMP-forming)/AMP-acid ligase II